MRRFMVSLAAAFVWCLSTQVQAQEWPSGQVTIIVPFSAGSTPDSLARIVAEGLQERLKQPFVVENRTGASGNTGTAAVAKAAPDGQTLGGQHRRAAGDQRAAVFQHALRHGQESRADHHPRRAAERAGGDQRHRAPRMSAACWP
jgi:hypothetical protein